MNVDSLIVKIKELTSFDHYVYYYGRKDLKAVERVLANYHHTPERLNPVLEPVQFVELDNQENRVCYRTAPFIFKSSIKRRIKNTAKIEC